MGFHVSFTTSCHQYWVSEGRHWFRLSAKWKQIAHCASWKWRRRWRRQRGKKGFSCKEFAWSKASCRLGCPSPAIAVGYSATKAKSKGLPPRRHAPLPSPSSIKFQLLAASLYLSARDSLSFNGKAKRKQFLLKSFEQSLLIDASKWLQRCHVRTSYAEMLWNICMFFP